MTRSVPAVAVFGLLALISGAFSTAALGADSKPRYGGTIIVGTESEPTTLNPYISNGSETVSVANHIFEKLVETDLSFAIIPAFAESWSVSSDGVAYTFKVAK